MRFGRVFELSVLAPCVLVPLNLVPMRYIDTGCHYYENKWVIVKYHKICEHNIIMVDSKIVYGLERSLPNFFPRLPLQFSHNSSKSLGGWDDVDHHASRNLNGHTALGLGVWSGLRGTTRPLTRCTGRLLGSGSGDIDGVVVLLQVSFSDRGNTDKIVRVLLL